MTRFCRSLRPLVALAVMAAALPAIAQDKIPVNSADDLPRHTYTLPGSATDLVTSKAQFDKLAAQVRKDILDDLEKYDIRDDTTLQGLYGALLSMDMLAADYDSALKMVMEMRKREDKIAARMMMGQTTEAYIAAKRAAGGDDAEFRRVFKEMLSKRIGSMPWETVGDIVEQNRTQQEIFSRNMMLGLVAEQFDPTIEQTNGEISADLARTLIGIRNRLEIMMPLREDLLEVYTAVIEANRVEKQDIWAERSVKLMPGADLKPVTVAIWDSGVDTPIFKGRLWTNPNETFNAKDDDGNGYIDDVHGIAYDLDANPIPELLCSIDDLNSDIETVTRHMKGYLDLSASIDSDEASEVIKMFQSLPRDQVKPVIEDLGLFGNYTHGTHVAGIAAEGNPFVRIMASRLTFDHRMRPRCPTIEQAHKDAKATRDTIAYYKANGVRVVNMSWGGNRQGIEDALEQNGYSDPEERAALAREIFKIDRDALYEAMRDASEILFVTSAGNADNDVEFDEMIPSGFDLPNLLVVGAVDQAGDPTDFTSFGRTVDVYGNGFEVDSYIPGGQRMKFSGTSMSSPQAVNLAAMILAHEPSYTPEQLISIIKKGSDKVKAGQTELLLLNPRRTLSGDIRPD
jgi:subtilisin family serine protease